MSFIIFCHYQLVCVIKTNIALVTFTIYKKGTMSCIYTLGTILNVLSVNCLPIKINDKLVELNNSKSQLFSY